MNAPVPFAPTDPLRIPTVAELQRHACHRLQLPAPFLRAFFQHWPEETVCDATWLRGLQSGLETIRQKVVHGAAESNRLQSAFNQLMEFIAAASTTALCRALAGVPSAGRLPLLAALVGFGLRHWERNLILLLESCPPEHAAMQLWAYREPLQILEARLGIAGLLVDTAPPAGAILELRPTYEDPAMAFALECSRARRQAGLTLRQLSRQVEMSLQHLQDFEKGRRVPGRGRDSLERVVALAAACKSPDLLEGYYVSRAHRDRLHEAAKRKDIAFGEYLTPAHRQQIDAVMAWDNRRTGVTRGGRRYSGGKLEDSTQGKYLQYFSMVLAYAQLPRNSANPRLRGLGLPPAEISILDAGDPVILEQMMAWFRGRNDRTTTAKSEASLFGKLRNYFDPRDGYFFHHAEALASTLPAASLARCPSVWPPGSDAPGTPCRNDIERIRARCHATYAALGPLLLAAQNAPPSPNRLRDITPAMAPFWHLLEALLLVLSHIPRRRPRQLSEALELQAHAIFALACFRPVRISEFAELRLNDIVVGADERVELRVHPKKNRGSVRAREQLYQLVPPELAQPLLDYLHYGRPLLAPSADSPWLFFNHQGKKVTEYHIRKFQRLLLVRHGQDIFPDGLTLHRRRSIVATDLVSRFGWSVGLALAAQALVDAESTVAKSYVLREPDPARQQAGPATQAAAVAAAWLAVTGKRFRPSPLRS